MREGENGERMSWGRRLTLDRPVSTREVARLKGVHIADWKIVGGERMLSVRKRSFTRIAGHVRKFCPASLETTFGS